MFQHHKKKTSSFWTHLFDNDTFQRRDIENNQAALSQVQESATSLSAQLQRERAARVALQQRVDRLELVLEGLVTVLRDERALDVAALKEAIQRIDALDGAADGRMAADTPRAPE